MEFVAVELVGGGFAGVCRSALSERGEKWEKYVDRYGNTLVRHPKRGPSCTAYIAETAEEAIKIAIANEPLD